MPFPDALVQTPNINPPLFQILAANMNTTADQLFQKNGSFSTFIVTSIIVTNASISLTLAVGGIYTAASKGGTPIVAAAQVYSGLTTSVKVITPAIALTDVLNVAPYLSLTTAQGAAATADIRIYGNVIS